MIEDIANRFVRRVIKDRHGTSNYMSRYYLAKEPKMPDGGYPFERDGTPKDGIVWAPGWGYVLHHFHRGDEARELHNHPWKWCVSVILSGGYREERLERDWNQVQERVLRPGSINVLRDTTFHRVDLLDEKEGCWTLFVHGPKNKGWGFLDRDTREFTDWRTFIRGQRS
jgi:hypothetical protein